MRFKCYTESFKRKLFYWNSACKKLECVVPLYYLTMWGGQKAISYSIISYSSLRPLISIHLGRSNSEEDCTVILAHIKNCVWYAVDMVVYLSVSIKFNSLPWGHWVTQADCLLFFLDILASLYNTPSPPVVWSFEYKYFFLRDEQIEAGSVQAPVKHKFSGCCGLPGWDIFI